MKDYVMLGSFWLNRDNFKRYVFAQFDANIFGFVCLNNGQRFGRAVHCFGAVKSVGDGKFVVPKAVFDAACQGTNFEEIEFGISHTPQNVKVNAATIPFPTEAIKPDHINVVRYVRATNNNGAIGNSGVTLIFDVHFKTMKFKCSYSMCSSADVFSKTEGVRIAKENADKKGSYIIGDYNKNVPLVANFIFAIDALYAKQNGNISQRLQDVGNYVLKNWNG